MVANAVQSGEALVAIAAAEPLPAGDVAMLHFPAGAGDFHAPTIAWGRVNESLAATGTTPATLPAVTAFSVPAPNPARTGASFTLALASADAAAHHTVRVVDVAGRTVRTLLDGSLSPGLHPLAWDLADDSGHPAPPGLYFVRARIGATSFTRRLTVVR
jgi:hypothetical protein